ncbi:MAG: hypothetical protein ACOYM0_12070 [Bacteroidales bacterium]
MNAIQNISILLELAVAILGLLIWLQKKKSYGALIFLTFLLYMVYDGCRLWTLEVPEFLLRIIFSLASFSILIAVWKLYKTE